MTEYAMYRGDTFVDLGTLEFLASKYNKKVSSLKAIATPSAHKHKRRTVLYKIEEDNDD